MSRGLTACYIGKTSDGLTMLAEVIRAKCERARHRHESIVVLMDDDGMVYASQLGSGATAFAVLKHPGWIVAMYSLAYAHNRVTQPYEVELEGGKTRTQYPSPCPSVKEIAADLHARQREILRRAA